MFVSNFYKYLRYVIINFASNQSAGAYSNTGILDTSGSGVAIFSNTYATTNDLSNSLNNHTLLRNSYVRLGTGTTEPTTDDYNLEASAPSGLSYSYSYLPFVNEDGKTVVRYTVIGTYTGTTPLTITEIGLFRRVFQSSSTGISKDVLFARSLLGDKAIALNPNDGFSLDYEVCI